ncbi:MAG TPA: GGDEF domain-containing protein, partial [Giesbergeria sp.]|nr:GGDEF domain-containing protein [Giesbergeria sp.]
QRGRRWVVTTPCRCDGPREFRDAQVAAQHARSPRHLAALHRCDEELLGQLLGAVNDAYGHHVGDRLLQQVARRLESCVRAVDLVARMSGDEFNVLLESIDPAEATQRAQQIAAALAAPYMIGEHTVNSGASIGLVSSASRLATVDDYLREADNAMYRAKSQSLGVCVFQ